MNLHVFAEQYWVPLSIKIWVQTYRLSHIGHVVSIEKDKSSYATVNQTNLGTVSRATLGKLPRDGMERLWAFPSAYIPSWTKLNWTELLCPPSVWRWIIYIYTNGTITLGKSLVEKILCSQRSNHVSNHPSIFENLKCVLSGVYMTCLVLPASDCDHMIRFLCLQWSHGFSDNKLDC